MKTECPETHNQTFEVTLKRGKIVDHACINFNSTTKACMASKTLPKPICPLYGKVWREVEKEK